MTSAWGFYYYFLRPFRGQPWPKGIEEAVPRENGDCEGVEEAPAKPHCGYRSKVAKQQAVMPTPWDVAGIQEGEDVPKPSGSSQILKPKSDTVCHGHLGPGFRFT